MLAPPHTYSVCPVMKPLAGSQKLSVRIGPGATTLTVMPAGASSSAHVLAIPIIPAFVAEYAVRVGTPSAARLEVELRELSKVVLPDICNEVGQNHSCVVDEVRHAFTIAEFGSSMAEAADAVAHEETIERSIGATWWRPHSLIAGEITG